MTFILSTKFNCLPHPVLIPPSQLCSKSFSSAPVEDLFVLKKIDQREPCLRIRPSKIGYVKTVPASGAQVMSSYVCAGHEHLVQNKTRVFSAGKKETCYRTIILQPLRLITAHEMRTHHSADEA